MFKLTRDFVILAATLIVSSPASAEVIHELTSSYHHIRIIEEGGIRELNFDDAIQTRMSVVNPLQGHFEYVEYFFTPWLWNPKITNALMLGLGGGSAQRLFQHYAPGVMVDTVEIDARVVRVARDFFNVIPTEKLRIHVSDGRVFLRRSDTRYDAIFADAYVSGRYGCSLPQHLATKEFFTLASDRLTTNGVMVYNVVGTLRGVQADIVGAVYRTMRAVFPQVYLFPARESQNVVLVATKAKHKVNLPSVRWKAGELARMQRMQLPGFVERVGTFEAEPPASFLKSPVLTDDFAPVEGLAPPME
jgi:spermidine synthase